MKSFINSLFGNTSETGGHSIQGRKPSQQDAWYISSETSNGQLVLVADGVGGWAEQNIDPAKYSRRLC